jgi:hypothetical protein
VSLISLYGLTIGQIIAMKTNNLKGIILGVSLFLIFSDGYSQDVNEKKIYNTKATNSPPVIDGHDKDECWNTVEWSGDFIQMQPEENKPPSQQTAFKILYDDNNLYVFIRAFDTEPDKISRIVSRRDYFTGDMVEINIDSYFDKQTAFSFSAMASGAKGDEAITDGMLDDSWNPVWFSRHQPNTKAGSNEIPFNQ